MGHLWHLWRTLSLILYCLLKVHDFCDPHKLEITKILWILCEFLSHPFACQTFSFSFKCTLLSHLEQCTVDFHTSACYCSYCAKSIAAELLACTATAGDLEIWYYWGSGQYSFRPSKQNSCALFQIQRVCSNSSKRARFWEDSLDLNLLQCVLAIKLH